MLGETAQPLGHKVRVRNLAEAPPPPPFPSSGEKLLLCRVLLSPLSLVSILRLPKRSTNSQGLNLASRALSSLPPLAPPPRASSGPDLAPVSEAKPRRRESCCPSSLGMRSHRARQSTLGFSLLFSSPPLPPAVPERAGFSAAPGASAVGTQFHRSRGSYRKRAAKTLRCLSGPLPASLRSLAGGLLSSAQGTSLFAHKASTARSALSAPFRRIFSHRPKQLRSPQPPWPVPLPLSGNKGAWVFFF